MDGTLYKTPTATRTFSVPIATTRVVGSTPTTVGRTTGGIARTVSRSPRKSLHFPVRYTNYFTGFCFNSCAVICPCHPPRFLPISSIFTDSAIYFLSSIDPVSQRIIKSICNVSTFRIAKRIYGCFSVGERKLAMETASILSINKLSIRRPKECLCNLGKI